MPRATKNRTKNTSSRSLANRQVRSRAPKRKTTTKRRSRRSLLLAAGQVRRSLALGIVLGVLLNLPFSLGPRLFHKHKALALSQPNIVVIMSDDQAALDGRLLNYMPKTKAAFVNQGVTFSDFHSETPLCCPARASFYTGQHTLNHGQTKNGSSWFKPQMTLATQLHALGYHTSIIGKYLNNFDAIAGSTTPGWDDFLVFGDPAYYNYSLYANGVKNPVESHGSLASDYSTDVLRDRAVSFIHNAPSTQPIFTWIAEYASHNPTTAAPRYTSSTACNSLVPWKPSDYNEADVSDKPQYVQQTPLISSNVGWKGTKVCKSLLATDDLVGAVRDELSSQGRLDNTIFVYGGDNGMNSAEHRLIGKESPYVTNIPFYLSWPARLGTSPTTINERIQNIDFAPTICEIVGCTLGPYPNGQQTPDGKSFASILFGNATTLGRDAVLQDLPYAVGTGVPAWYAVETTGQSPLASQVCSSAGTNGCRWHYVEYSTGEKELYDVSNGPCWTWRVGQPGDPCELDNLLRTGSTWANDPTNASLLQSLQTRLAQLKAEKGRGI